MLLATSEPAACNPAAPEVVLQTTLGEIVIRVHEDRAPRTSAWVLDLVERGLFDGTRFYRAGILQGQAEPSLIEGGMLDRFVLDTGAVPIGESGLPRLADFETTEQSGLNHRTGTVSLARDLFESGDAIPDLVICLEDLPQLDAGGLDKPDARGFPAFGEVVAGLEVAQRILRMERLGDSKVDMLKGQVLTQPVVILHAHLRSDPT